MHRTVYGVFDTIYNAAFCLYHKTRHKWERKIAGDEAWRKKLQNIRSKSFWLEKYKPKVFIFHIFLCLSMKIVLLKINCKRTEKTHFFFSGVVQGKARVSDIHFPLWNPCSVLFPPLWAERSAKPCSAALPVCSWENSTSEGALAETSQATAVMHYEISPKHYTSQLK